MSFVDETKLRQLNDNCLIFRGDVKSRFRIRHAGANVQASRIAAQGFGAEFQVKVVGCLPVFPDPGPELCLALVVDIFL